MSVEYLRLFIETAEQCPDDVQRKITLLVEQMDTADGASPAFPFVTNVSLSILYSHKSFLIYMFPYFCLNRPFVVLFARKKCPTTSACTWSATFEVSLCNTLALVYASSNLDTERR